MSVIIRTNVVAVLSCEIEVVGRGRYGRSISCEDLVLLRVVSGLLLCPVIMCIFTLRLAIWECKMPIFPVDLGFG